MPERLEEMLELARHLSRSVVLSFVRVDLYDTSSGIVFGELTRCPGERKVYYPEHDAAMGLAWGQARWRLALDILRGRPPHTHGPHPASNPCPASYVSASSEPGAWQPQVYDCDTDAASGYRRPYFTGSTAYSAEAVISLASSPKMR